MWGIGSFWKGVHPFPHGYLYSRRFVVVSVLSTFAFLVTGASALAYYSPSVLNPTVFSYQNSTPTVNGETGALTQDIKLDIPPGRNGLQPDLSLDYDSQDTDQGSEVGYGWSLSIPYIERLNKTGSENLYGSNAYFTSSLDGELASAATTTTISTISTTTTTLINVLAAYWKLDGNSNDATSTNNGTDHNITYSSGNGKINEGAGYNGSTSYISMPNNSAFTPTGSPFTISMWVKTATSTGAALFSTYQYANGACSGNCGWTLQINGADPQIYAYDSSGSGHGLTDGTPVDDGNWHFIVAGWDGGNTNNFFLYVDGVAATTTGSTGSIKYGTTRPTMGADQYNASTINAYLDGDIDEVGFWDRTLSSTEVSELYNSGNGLAYPFTGGGNASTSASMAGIYYPRVDEGSLDQYNFSTSTDSWTMFDKQGNEYLFGSSTQAQQYATSTPGNIYKWMLEKEIDPNGNYVRYVYTKDHNQIYPSEIIYTGHNGTDGPMTITFSTSTRPDGTINYLPGFEVDTDFRIATITAAVNGNAVRQYNLSYTTGNNSYRSLLSSVQENGWDDNNVETSEPAMTFGYMSSTTSFVTQNASYTGNCGGDPWIAADSSGDGKNDLINTNINNTDGVNGVNVLPGGSGSMDSVSAPTSTVYWSYSNSSVGGCATETGTRLVSLTGNGKADIVKGSYNNNTGNTLSGLYYNVSTPGSYDWTASTTYTGMIPNFQITTGGGATSYSTGILGAVDGNGLPDYVYSIASGYAGAGTQTYMGNGSAFGTATTTIFQAPKSFPPGTTDCTNSQLVDVTGDGLLDWVYTDGTNTYVLLNTGSGWESTPDPRWTIPTSTVYESGGNCYDRGMRFVDINGDGLPDFVRSYDMPANNGGSPPEIGNYQFVYLNTGSGWATSTAYTVPTILQGNLSSGNYISTTDSELANFEGNGQQYQDVLSTITYPKGGSTDVNYGYTSQSGRNPQLPYSLLTVTNLVNNNGYGSDEPTTYVYGGGLQYFPSNVFDRKFAGFAESTSTTPDATTVTYYDQGTLVQTNLGEQSDGYAQINHPFREDVFTPGGTLVKQTFYRWDAYVHGNATTTASTTSTFVGLGRQLELDYAGNETHEDKDTDYVYSSTTDSLLDTYDYGEVTASSIDLGTFSTSSPSSLRTTVTSYAASSSINLVVPMETTLFNSSGATTTDTKYFYDNLPFGEVNIGNQTEEENLISTSSLNYASTTRAYNSYGLVASSTDANGHVTSYSYDSYNMYPATTTNPLSQSTENTYEYSNGKTEETIHANGGILENIYDGLGRLIKVEQSDPTSTSTLDVKETLQYQDNSSPPSVVAETDYLNSASTTQAYDYYDGLGRLIQERKSSGTSGTYNVTDSLYGTDGLLASQSLPYSSSGASSTSATTTSYLFTNYAYDPLGRTLTSANAVGTTTNVYNGWTTTVTDPLGHIKDYLDDAFGNLAEVVEHGATSNATTTYAYDAANNLTNITDASGNVRNFTYDGLGRELTAQDLHIATSSSFGTWTYVYDANGNLISQTDPKSQVATLTYDGLNRLLTETVGPTTEVTDTYDSCTNGIGYQCSASSTSAYTAYSYDILGRVTNSTTTIQGSTYPTSYTYDRQGNITGLTNPNNAQITYTYNPAGLVSAVNRTSGASVTPIAQSIAYAATNDISQIFFGSGATTTYTYDPSHLYRLTQLLTLSPISTTTTLTLNSTLPASLAAYWKLDGNSNDATSTNNGTDSNITYSNGNGKINEGAGFNGSSSYISIPDNSVFSSGDFAISMWVKTTSNAGGALFSTYQYENGACGGDCGWTLQLNGADPQMYAYDSSSGGHGTLDGTPVDDGNWHFIVAGWDGGNTGNLFLYVDGVAATTTGSTGSIGYGTSRPTMGADQYNASTVSGYYTGDIDEVGFWGRTLSSTEVSQLYNGGSGYPYPFANGTTTFSGDIPLQNLTYTYDADGNILTRNDNSNIYEPNQATAFAYDDLNRLTSASTTGNNINPYDQTYSYDALGNIQTGPEGSYTYGQVENANPDATTKTVDTYGGSAPTIAYDNSTLGGNGVNASSLTFSHTTNSNTNGLIVVVVKEATSTGACASDTVTGVTYNASSLTDLGYYVGNASPVGGAIKSYYGFAPAQGAHNVVVSASASCIRYAVAATYTGVKQSGIPDASGTGNPLNDSGSVSLFQATTTTSANNAWAILAGAPSLAGTATAGSNTDLRQQQTGELYYADSNGPISPAGSVGLNWSMPSATHWLANYFSIPPVTSSPPSVTIMYYGYDLNGNLVSATTTATTTTYGYDYANRLASSSVAGVVTTYGYDTQGNRVFQTTGNVTTIYPSKFFAETINTSGATTTATSTEFVYGGSQLLATIDQPIISGTATGTSIIRYIHPDNLGSTNVTSDANGNLAEAISYAPYGSVLSDINATASTSASKGFEGLFRDTSTNLVYSNARYLNPVQGQFTSEDPVFLSTQQNLSDPQSLNAYSYSEDNPIIKEDPSGKCPECVTAVVGAGIGGLIGVGGQALGDSLSGHLSSWQTYAGDAAGGATLGAFWGSGAGVVTLAATGFTSGLIQGDVREGLNFLSGNNVDGSSIAQDAILGGILNVGGGIALKYIGLPAIEGLNAGPGSYDSIFKQIFTNIDSGAISNVSPSTYAEMGISYGYNGLYSTGASAMIEARQQATQSYNATLGGSGSVSSGGASVPNANSLWTTPSGAVVTFGGSLVAGPVANSTPSH